MSEKNSSQRKLIDCKKAYNLKLQQLGETHLETLAALDDLACAYGEIGDIQKRQTLLEKEYVIRKKFYGIAHPDTLQLLSFLSYMYEDIGFMQKALTLWQKAYECICEVLEEVHPDKDTLFAAIYVLDNLAAAYRESGEYQTALEMFQTVYDLRKRFLGEENEETLNAFHDLAITYSKLGEHLTAMEMFEQEYNLRKDIFGESNTQTLFALNEMANEYRELEIYTTAIELYQKLYNLCCYALGEEHIYTLEVLSEIEVTKNKMEEDSQTLLFDLQPEPTEDEKQQSHDTSHFENAQEHASLSNLNTKSKSGGDMKVGSFLLPIEDVFTNPSLGTVITGKITRGTVKKGDILEIVGITNERIFATVVGIEMQGKTIDKAKEDDVVGVLLDGVSGYEAKRGQVLCEPNTIFNHKKFSANVSFFSEQNERLFIDSCMNGIKLSYYFRTIDISGTTIRDNNRIISKDNTFIIEIDTPIAIERDLQFAIHKNGQMLGIGTVTSVLDYYNSVTEMFHEQENGGSNEHQRETSKRTIDVKDESNPDFEFEKVYNGYILKKCNSKMKNIVIPETYKNENVVGVGTYAFSCGAIPNEWLESVTFPSRCESISAKAFLSCVNLKKIHFNKYLKKIGKSAFYNCRSLESVKIPFGCERIAESAFENCINLKEVILPRGLKSIRERAFYRCRITSISIPQGCNVFWNAFDN